MAGPAQEPAAAAEAAETVDPIDASDVTGREPPIRPKRRRRRILLTLLAALALLVLLGGVLAVVRYLPAYDDAKALRTDIAAIVKRVASAGLDMDRPTLDAVRADLARATDRLDRLDDLLRNDPLVGLARALPPTRDAVLGADGVAAAGLSLTSALAEGLQLGDTFVAIREQHATGSAGDSTLASLVALMASSQDRADRILGKLEAARQALATVPLDVPAVIAGARDEMLARLDAYQPLLATYADVDGTLPAILGWDRPKRYLVLTQDPAELRPSGGIVGTFGIITFDKGRITQLTFTDVGELDTPTGDPFIEAPSELVGYLLGPGQRWQLADSNWSPDYPTSAQDALRLYTIESGDKDIDGVLAITTQTVDELLRVTGPVTVSGYDVTIAAGETTLKMLQNTRRAGPGEQRKAILGVFAGQLISRLFALPPGEWAGLAGTADTLRVQRLLQAWFRDPAAQALVDRDGWSGSVRTDAGDYVYPVDANVAPVSKLNYVTTRSIDLAVQVDEVGNARSTMSLAWENGIDTAEGAPLRAIKDNMGSLHDLGLFERVLVPARSRLEQVSGGSYQELTGPTIDTESDGRHVFGNYLRVPPGRTTLQYAWTAPYVADITDAADGGLASGEYRLVIQKQPGLQPGPLSVSIAVPDGMTITGASRGVVVSGSTARLELLEFDQDVELSVSFASATP